MPPQRQIIVDTNKILQSIYDTSEQQQQAAREKYHGLMRGAEALPAALAEACWVKRNVSTLAQTLLTPSERKRWQEGLRQLIADGLVDAVASWVRLTDKGRDHVLQKTAGEPPAERPPQ